MTTPLENLRKHIQRLHRYTYPVFAINKSEGIFKKDGIVFIGDRVLDDTNIEDETLGMRRLKTPFKKRLYRLILMVEDVTGVLKNRGRTYIDSEGRIFKYEKLFWSKLKYYKISSVERMGTFSVIHVIGINFPVTVSRPPPASMPWAGFLHVGELPWILYGYSENKLKDTKRKI